MWTPLIAALITNRETRNQLLPRLKRGGWWFWPVAIICGWSFGIGQQLVLIASHLGHWNADTFQLDATGHAIKSVKHVAMVLGVNAQSFGFFGLNLVLSIVLGSLITMLTGALGEEGGWRGVLQPEMERRFGVIKGTILVGLIWGYWHLPANLAGYNDSQHPVLGSLIIFPLMTISMAFVFAWLVRRSKSVWPSALAHGANNVLYAGLLIVPNNWFADQLTAILAAIGLGIFFAWRLAKEGKDKPTEMAYDSRY